MADFTTVTELPGAPYPTHALSMLYTRYAFAARSCAGADVLEIACGGGPGLGYLARSAKTVTGMDIDDGVLAYPLAYYKDRANVSLRQGDAGRLPFEDSQFDVVIIFEAIYYFPDIDAALRECKRVLRPGGRLVLCSVNPEWHGFDPSPHSVRYYSAGELSVLLEHHGFNADLYAGYEDRPSSRTGFLLSLIKRFAVRFHLIPGSMKSKVFLKRLLYGKLQAYPAELTDDFGPGETPKPVEASKSLPYHTVIYVNAELLPAK